MALFFLNALLIAIHIRIPRAGDSSGDQTEDISPLGRRSRADSPDGDADILVESMTTKVPRSLGTVTATAAERGGDAAVGSVHAAGFPGEWGGGAEFLLDPVLTTPLQRDQVRVDLSEEFSRKAHPDQEVKFLVAQRCFPCLACFCIGGGRTGSLVFFFCSGWLLLWSLSRFHVLLLAASKCTLDIHLLYVYFSVSLYRFS